MTKTLISTNPAKNYSPIGSVPITSHNDISQKVNLANQAKTVWQEIGLEKRIKYVRRISDLCKERAQEIALMITKEIGTPITASLEEVLWNKGYFDWFIANAKAAVSPVVVGEDEASQHTVFYEPLGTAAVITPWNLPFDMFVWGVIPNLLVGNTVVYKAAEECALTGALLETMCVEAGLPEGVLSFIHGGSEEGKLLIEEPIDLIWFTGSTEVGQKLNDIAGKKFIPAILEMGGSNPAIIFEDADIDKAVSAVCSKRFMFCGQTCDADKRLIVHESIFDEVVYKIKNKLSEIVVGEPEDSTTTLGPLVSEKQLSLLTGQVADAVKNGATIFTNGNIPSKLRGAYVMPALLTNITQSMRIWKEEVFGPILPVLSFKTDDEAIALANDTQFGLGSQIFTNDRKRITKMASAIEAGNVDVNGVGHFRPYNPFGGYKKSGMGREHGIEGFRELCKTKIVSTPKHL